MKSLAEIEREHIAFVLKNTSTLDEAARVLGIDIATLYRKRIRMKFKMYPQHSGERHADNNKPDPSDETLP
jgi:DNA-binding NtrC family response regulator